MKLLGETHMENERGMKGKRWTDKGRENKWKTLCKVQKGIPYMP
jgi:hypothetical protein